MTAGRTSGAVIVEVTDDGPGMTADVQAHAMQPFFTTKPVGKGTGLGLDICRRIVVIATGATSPSTADPGVRPSASACLVSDAAT